MEIVWQFFFCLKSSKKHGELEDIIGREIRVLGEKTIFSSKKVPFSTFCQIKMYYFWLMEN